MWHFLSGVRTVEFMAGRWADISKARDILVEVNWQRIGQCDKGSSGPPMTLDVICPVILKTFESFPTSEQILASPILLASP